MGKLYGKDFEEMARIIRENAEIFRITDRDGAWMLVKEFCEYLKGTNPKFNKYDFAKKCGF